MKNLIKLISLSLILTLFSCDKDSDDDSQVTVQPVECTTSVPITNHNLDEIPEASSTIHRNADGITASFITDGLVPGNAYTLWFVVFGDAPGPPSSTHAAGQIVGTSGKVTFSGHLSAGDIFDTPNSTMPVFNSPLTAEVHIVLRTHGPAQTELLPDQIQSIDGGCTSGFPSGPVLHPDSEEVGYCANMQVAIHPSVD